MRPVGIRSFQPAWRPWVVAAIAAATGLAVGVACLFLPPLFAVGGILGVLFLLVALDKPEWAILLVVAITVGLIDDDRLPLIPLGPVSLHISDAVLMFLVVLAVTKPLLTPGQGYVTTPLDAPIIWFYGAVLVGAAITISKGYLGTNFIFQRVRPLTYYLAFFAVTGLIRDRAQLNRLMRGILAIAMLSSIAMCLQVVFPSLRLVGSSVVELETAGREYSGVVRTYMQAERLIFLLIPVLVASLMMGERRYRKMHYAALALLGVGLFLTYQRNYWATMLVSLFALAFFLPSRARLSMLAWATAGAVALAVLLTIPAVRANSYVGAALDRFIWGTKLETLEEDSSTQMRVMETKYAVPTALKHPLMGIGFAGYYRPPMKDEAYYGEDGLRWYMHNAYLLVIVDLGLVGFVPFIWMYAAFIIRGLTRWRRISDPGLQPIVLGLSLAMCGQAISNIVAPNFVQSWALSVFAIAFAVNELIYRWDSAAPDSPGPMHLLGGNAR